MTTYHPHGFHVSEYQKKKLINSLKKSDQLTLSFKHNGLKGDHTFYLTNSQLGKVSSAIEKQKGLRLKFSKAQLEYNKKSGGFLAALLPFLAEAAPALLGSLAGWGATKAIDAIDKKVRGEGLTPLGGQVGPLKIPVNFYPSGIVEQGSADDYRGSGLFIFGSKGKA